MAARIALVMLFPFACVSTVRADLVIHGLLITRSGAVVDTLASTLELKGPQLRRRLEGKGTLADFFGRRTELVNRVTGESAVLDLDALTCQRSTSGPTYCHPFHLIDLRWLGRTQPGVTGELVLPDTTATIMGALARPLDLRFPPRRAGRSTIRIWVVRQLDSLFGAGGAHLLYCGGSRPQASAHLGEALARQFGLSSQAAVALREATDGYPVRIENFLEQDGLRTELSRFETTDVIRGPLADSIFIIPETFRPAESQD